ncbi:MAG: DUF3127 domain-containing protein [Bacteroidales bacterium]|nr:DUF3127 domain-containing protein [Bacteroidales bacterium]
MPNLEIEGTLLRKMDVQSGRSARGDWAKQEFLVEFQEGKFPTTAVFTAWGQDKVSELDKFSAGDQVKVAFNISSREYQGRWYTDLRMWKISEAGVASAPSAPAAPAAPAARAPMASSVPAGFQAAPAPSLADMPAESEEDDLPF